MILLLIIRHWSDSLYIGLYRFKIVLSLFLKELDHGRIMSRVYPMLRDHYQLMTFGLQDSSSDVSPIAATRLFGREVSNISSFSTHSHNSEGSAPIEHSAQEIDNPPAGTEHINPERHIVNSSQGSQAQVTPEDASRREEIPHTPTPRRSRSIYVESTFLDEVTPERLRSGNNTGWHPSPSERASQRAAERQLQKKSKPSPIAHTSTSATHTR
jgi:hypothetical protein